MRSSGHLKKRDAHLVLVWCFGIAFAMPQPEVGRRPGGKTQNALPSYENISEMMFAYH